MTLPRSTGRRFFNTNTFGSSNNNSNNNNDNTVNRTYIVIVILSSLIPLSVIFFTGPNNLYDRLTSPTSTIASTTTTSNEIPIGNNNNIHNNNNINAMRTTTTTDIHLDSVVIDPFVLERFSSSSSSQNNNDYDDCKLRLTALEQSFNHRRNMRKQYAKHHYDDLGTAPSDETMFDLYEPEAICIAEERFGTDTKNPLYEIQRYQAFGDGPKFVCGLDRIMADSTSSSNSSSNSNSNKNSPCLIYSFALVSNHDFEKSVSQVLPTCELHTFNPAVQQEDGSDYHGSIYHSWALGTMDGYKTQYGATHFETFTLPTIQSKLGHVGRTIDILKIDCEKCEYKDMILVFDAITKGILKVNQILIEMHSFGIDSTIDFFHEIQNFFESMDRAKLRIFHKERNGWNCGGNVCVEYALISETFLQHVNADYVCGTGPGLSF